MASLKKFLILSFFTALTILEPIHSALASAALLVTADFVTGIWKSKKLGIKITSSGIRDSFTKMFLYLLGISLAFSIESGMKIDYFPWVKSVCFMIALTELKSILENADKILGTPVFYALLKKLGSKNRE